MQNKIIKSMVLSSVVIIMFMMIKYNASKKSSKKRKNENLDLRSSKKRKNENLDLNDQKYKKRQSSRQTDDNVCPDLSDPQWKKIGKVSRLMIYPIKSSVEAMHYNSCEFYDYGMCKLYSQAYFYDGMFIVYNRTRHKFEDARRYPLLECIAADLTNNAKNALLSGDGRNNTVKVNIRRDRIPSSSVSQQTWSGDTELFYGSNQRANTWIQEMIDARLINHGYENIILTQMIPRDWHSKQKIKDNWSRFVQGYETMEEDDTGKLITLPRFVLMTSQTRQMLIERRDYKITPNIIIDTDELIHPFEEENWDLIKIGNNVILKKVKPVPRNHLNEEFQHRGIYYGLWNGGTADKDDDVFIYSSNLFPRKKLKFTSH